MSAVSSMSSLSGSGSRLSPGNRPQVCALFTYIADSARVIRVHFWDPDLLMHTLAPPLPPSIVILQAPASALALPHSHSHLYRRTSTSLPLESAVWREDKMEKRECYIFCLCLGIQVRPSPASSVIFLFLVTAACLVSRASQRL